MFLSERLSDERMYSVYDLFVLLAELMNESIEDTDFYGFNIEEIEKIVSEDYEEHKCFERRRDGAMLESSEDTYLMNKIFVFDLLDEVQSRIKLKKDVFYSVKDVLKRLEYLLIWTNITLTNLGLILTRHIFSGLSKKIMRGLVSFISNMMAGRYMVQMRIIKMI